MYGEVGNVKVIHNRRLQNVHMVAKLPTAVILLFAMLYMYLHCQIVLHCHLLLHCQLVLHLLHCHLVEPKWMFCGTYKTKVKVCNNHFLHKDIWSS